MAKTRSLHVCSNCGYQSPRWLGRCPDCGEWNTLVEEVVSREVTGGRRPAPAAAPFRLQEVVAGQGERIPTGVGEFDRVLGGGLVRGSVVLLGGEPGIGKSSLLLQAMLQLDRAQVPVLLVSGEESPEQVRMRADRISPGATSMRMITETEAGAVIACLQEHLPQVCVVDSVQMLWSAELSSAPGSVSQIREVTGQLVRVAKTAGIALVLVGHVTKSGDLAGPRVLEHLVDSVLAFEGERGQDYRILRAVKNRFGSTNEVGVFQMTDRGLEGVEDPSELFLESAQALPGSSVVAALEGSRCLLAEVQALVVPTGFPSPRHVTRGVDRNRLAMLVAVLSRRAGLALGDCDVFLNVAGGLTLDDPAADLPVALSLASAWRDKPLRSGAAALGEVSLTGEVRHVNRAERRVAELTRRGYTRVAVAKRTAAELERLGTALPRDLELVPVTSVREAVEELIG